MTEAAIITLTTDFGMRDPFVATMKGQIYKRLPTARIVDMTHEVVAYWPMEAGFWLERAHPYFPPGTVHVAVVDPGVGTSRNVVALEAAGHRFLAPDNGLLTPLLARDSLARAYRIDVDGAIERFGLGPLSATFHGRDLFAPLAAELAAGRAAIHELGPLVEPLRSQDGGALVVTDDAVTGVIITVDHFGNLLTNIEAQFVQRFERPVVRVGGCTLPFRRTYGDTHKGECVALISSFGVLEIAIREQSAAAVLGFKRGMPVRVERA